MCRKLMYLFIVVALSSLASVGWAEVTSAIWEGDVSQDWSVGANWDTGLVPDSNNRAEICNALGTGLEPPAIISTDVGTVDEVHVSNTGWSVQTLIVDGGSIAINNALVLGYHQGYPDQGNLEMKGGSITAAYLNVGYYGTGYVDMTGGTISVWGVLIGATQATSVGHVDLHGGLLEARGSFFWMGDTPGSTGSMDITTGTFQILNDWSDDLRWTNGMVTAYDGSGSLVIDFGVTRPGWTTVTGLHLLNPDPTNGNLDVLPTVGQLSWTNPEPNDPCAGGVITCDVYFGTNEPNEANQPSCDLPQIVFDEEVNSVAVSLSPVTTYYWKVDCFDSSPGVGPNSVMSGLFTFATNNGNIAPVVDAGLNVRTWLTGGTVDVTLAGVLVEDDGIPVASSTLWTVISEPNEITAPATFTPEPPVDLDSVITMTLTGDYVLQLEADDTEKTGTDTMTINVYEDACAAAKAVPGFELLDGDSDEDCDVDLVDVALLAINWLESNPLVSNNLY